MLRSTLYIIHFTLAIVFTMASCTPDTECRQDEHVRCKVVFYESIVDNTPYTFDSLTVQGVGSDSILYDNTKSVSFISLPLRNDANMTQFVLTTPQRFDTLTIYHTPAPYFVSMACGCFVFHTIDSVATYGPLFWKGEVVNTAVQNIEDENIKLYYNIPLP